MNKSYYVYIMGNHHLTLYIGITSDLVRRVYEHKASLVKGFTQKYKCQILLHYEIFNDPQEAIEREKCLKRWKREWKLKLIRKVNPAFVDLYPTIT